VIQSIGTRKKLQQKFGGRMYTSKRDLDLWTLSDIAKFLGYSWTGAAYKITKEVGFPKPLTVGKRKYWKKQQIEKYYETK